MNKKEYLAKLRMYLQGLPISELEDIISDYDEHFNVGISKGKSEEEISKELGDPKEVALSYKNTIEANYEENRYERRKGTNWLAIIVGTLLIVTVISLISLFDKVNSIGNFVNVKSNGDTVRIGTKGIEVKDGDDHVSIGWGGIKVKDGTDEVSIGWDGIRIKESTSSNYRSNSGWNFFGLFNGDLKWEEVNEEKLANIDGVKNISISSPFVDIKVISEDRDDVRIYYHGRMKTNVVPELVVDEKKAYLDIKLELPKKSYSVNNSNVVLEVFIPKSFNGNVNTNASSGDIYMKNIVGEDISFDTSSGDLLLEDLEGKTINITTSSGDMSLSRLVGEALIISTSSGDMKLKDLVGKLTVNSSSGDISLENITSEEVLLYTSSGDIVFSLDGNANYKIKGSTSSGDFIPKGTMIVEENHRGRFRATIGNGINSLEIKTSSGDVIFK
ncbi:MAG: DUF4097 family beta strand repeat protein [Tissierellia bacterium]|nr:DUF4097 family beta strand repeat protein [Tissierellia bacterium]